MIKSKSKISAIIFARNKKEKSRIPFILFIFLIWIIFFGKFFFKGLLPIPADIFTGAYFPWLDYKWGYSVGVPVKNAMLSDSVSQAWIWREWGIAALKNGKIAIWNPYALGGYPLSPWFHTALFSPANIFYFFTSSPVADALIISTQIVACLLGMFLFLSHLLKNNLAALFGSVSFSFSAFFLGWLTWGTISWTIAFLPFILFFINKLSEKPNNTLFSFGLYFSLLFSFLSGYPQTFVYVFLIGFLYLLLKKGMRFSIKKKTFLIMTLSILSAAFVWLPSLEILTQSIRNYETYISRLNFGLLPFSKVFILLFAPNFFGSTSSGNYWDKNMNYQEQLVWFGTSALMLALSYFVIKKRKDKLRNEFLFFLFIFLLGMALSLEYSYGFFVYYLKIPFLSTALASRTLFLTTFSGSVLAAFGFKHFLVGKKDVKEWRKFFLVWVIIIVKVLAYLSLVKNSPVLGRNLKVAIRNLIIPFSFSLGTVLILRASYFFKGKKWWLNILALGLIGFGLFEGFYFGWRHTPFIKKEIFFPKTPVIEFVQEKYKNEPDFFRVERQSGPLLPPNSWMYYQFYSMAGYDPIYPLAYANVLRDLKVKGEPSRYVEWTEENTVFNNYGVKYWFVLKQNSLGIFTSKGDLPYFVNQEKWKLVFEDGAVAVLENQQYRPPYSLVGLDYQAIETEINLTKKEDDLWEFSVEADEESFFVVAENNFPGWKVMVNGLPSSLETYENNFKAVRLKPGLNRVVFFYHNMLFKRGVFISIFFLSSFICLNYFWIKKDFISKIKK